MSARTLLIRCSICAEKHVTCEIIFDAVMVFKFLLCPRHEHESLGTSVIVISFC